MNNMKNTIELNEEVYANTIELNEEVYANTIELNEEAYANLRGARTIALQKSNEDYEIKLKGDCKTMRDAFNRFINIDVPSSFKYRDSEYYFKSIGDTFRMYEFRHPMECISNFGEIEYKIEKNFPSKYQFDWNQRNRFIIIIVSN